MFFLKNVPAQVHEDDCAFEVRDDGMEVFVTESLFAVLPSVKMESCCSFSQERTHPALSLEIRCDSYRCCLHHKSLLVATEAFRIGVRFGKHVVALAAVLFIRERSLA